MRGSARRTRRRGVVLILTAICLVTMLAFVALAIDVGYINIQRARCQNAADAAAFAAAGMLDETSNDFDAATNEAIAFAEANAPDVPRILAASDVEFGSWSGPTREFVPDARPTNAVRVTTRREKNCGNAVPLFFGAALGTRWAETATSAVAVLPPANGSFRFILDEDMIDSDEPSIEKLAASRGVPPDDMISDRNGDGFLDLPPGAQLELPTGQVGDEGMFDRSAEPGAFPFGSSAPYTTLEFLAEGTQLQQSLGTRRLQDATWTSENAPLRDLVGAKILDPVPGTTPLSSQSQMLTLPSPRILMSPVYKSDVSVVERDPAKYGAAAANLLGERRGLLAYKIVSARPSPAGGSYLPWLTIEIVSPQQIDVASAASAPTGGASARRILLAQ